MPDGAPTTYTELADVLDALPLLCREKRRRCGLSIREAARQIGVSFSTVHRIEDGKGAHLDNATAVLRWLDDHSTRPIPPAVCNCIVVRDLARERYVWMNGSFGDCGHPPTGTPVTEKTRPIPPGEGRTR